MSSNDAPSRRELMGVLTAGTLAASFAGQIAAQPASGEIPQRPFGKTGIKVSAIGLGGSQIGNPSDENEGVRIVRTTIDNGITFMDNCWDYHSGKSEVVKGKALRDGYRQKVFLMTKFDGRTKQATARQIDESLQRLQTDHLDLIQFHENIRLEDPDRFFAEGVRSRRSSRRKRRVKFASSVSPATKIRSYTRVCSSLPTSTIFTSIRRRCRSMFSIPFPQLREKCSAETDRAQHGGARYEAAGRRRNSS